jgi:hypothetical protein
MPSMAEAYNARLAAIAREEFFSSTGERCVGTLIVRVNQRKKPLKSQACFCHTLQEVGERNS